MANVKISALPSYTGSAADLRWFVMNNSGENETFKYSGYTSPFKVFGANNSNNIYDTTAMAGTFSSIIGGQSNTMSSTGSHNFIGGGQGNTLGANTTQSTIIAGFNNNIQATILGFIGGTQDNTITSAGYTYVLVGGGYNTVNATNASAGNAMYSSYFCTDNTINDGSTIGSSNNWFAGSRNCAQSGYGKHNWIANSYSSTIVLNPSSDVYEWFNKIDSSSGSSINYSRQSQILGGVDNTIDQVANSVILGGSGNTINGESSNIEKFNMILGGSGNTIFNASTDQIAQTIFNSRNTTLQNGGERITAIGLSGRTINGAAVGTTFVENLYAYRQIINQSKDNGSVDSAGYYVDLREGQKQTITITGSGVNSIYFTGATTGGGLKLKVINTSTGSLSFVDGSSPTIWRLPATMNPQTANGTDIYVFESFEDGNLWLTSHMQNLS